MRVIKLPKGSRTRKITVTVDGERVSAEFKKDGTAKVGNDRAEKLCRAIKGLECVGDPDADDTTQEEE